MLSISLRALKPYSRRFRKKPEIKAIEDRGMKRNADIGFIMIPSMVIGQPLMKHKRKISARTCVTRWLIACVALLWLTAGCAGTSSQTASGPPLPHAVATVPDGDGWWSVRFKMDRPEKKTHWERDLLIAHRITAPLIRAYQADIELWRYHRRSAGDLKGHQFSFIFFASAETADQINRQVNADPLVEQLLSVGVVKSVLTDTVDHNDRQAVGDTSDPSWSVVMQDSWPYFIMGVSRMWLEMIDQVSKKVGFSDAPTCERLLEHYETVNVEVTHIWQNESYHALLHHLNAIFGYEAMIFSEKSWKSF